MFKNWRTVEDESQKSGVWLSEVIKQASQMYKQGLLDCRFVVRDGITKVEWRKKDE